MEDSTILVAVTVILVGYLFHKNFIKIYDYWPKRGIPCVKGALPFFGNNLPMYLLRKDLPTLCDEIYKSHGNCSMVGFYQNRRPTLMLRDPELVRIVLISAFSHFHSNFLNIDPELDPLLAQNPFFIDGKEWKTRRNYLSNAVMSSKKLKVLCTVVMKVCAKFTKYVEDHANESNGAYEVEAKDLFTRFTGEVVANIALGIEGDFFSDKNNPNSFRGTIEGLFKPSLLKNINYVLIFFAPTLNKLFRCRFLPKRVDRFFKRVTQQVVTARRNDATVARNDFIQLMLEAYTDKNGETDQFGVTSSASSFFVAGYETSAITLLFFAYQLAVNVHVQDKLRREVVEVLEKHGGDINYDSLAEMTYMEQALNESMRLHSAFGILMKRCNERCKLVGDDGIECIVEPGNDLIVPFESFQLDPKYWDNPEVYNPDRFSDDASNGRPKTVFLPFGEGPRFCVGKRFAMMQMKAVMATMLRGFTIELSTKTKLPLELTNAPLRTVVGGLWINIKPL